MGLGDIVHRDSVLKAIAECDSMGEGRFLSHYGFKPSRSYHLVHEGRKYPSKAIMGVAHQFEFPDRGPLLARDFSGGEKTVRHKLAELGFEVVVSGPTADRPARQSPIGPTNSATPRSNHRSSLHAWGGPQIATVVVESEGSPDLEPRRAGAATAPTASRRARVTVLRISRSTVSTNVSVNAASGSAPGNVRQRSSRSSWGVTPTLSRTSGVVRRCTDSA